MTGAKLITEAKVLPGGFGWTEPRWRWLAYSGLYFAYAPTADEALTELAGVIAEGEQVQS